MLSSNITFFKKINTKSIITRLEKVKNLTKKTPKTWSISIPIGNSNDIFNKI